MLPKKRMAYGRRDGNCVNKVTISSFVHESRSISSGVFWSVLHTTDSINNQSTFLFHYKAGTQNKTESISFTCSVTNHTYGTLKLKWFIEGRRKLQVNTISPPGKCYVQTQKRFLKPLNLTTVSHLELFYSQKIPVCYFGK